MYKLCFPYADDEKTDHSFAIFPDSVGLLNNQWWHAHLEKKFKNVKDALAFGNKIKKAYLKGQPCPCEEGCWFKKVSSEGREVYKVSHFPNNPGSAR